MNDQVMSTKLYKKSSSDGKVTLCLPKREFIDHITSIDPIEGLIIFDEDYVKENDVYVAIFVTFRYGREDSEVMNIRFARDTYPVVEKISPVKEPNVFITIRPKDKSIPEKTYATNTFPFKLEFPQNSSHSLSFVPGPENYGGQTCGVYYEVKIIEADPKNNKEVKRDVVGMAIKLVQRMDIVGNYQPQSSFKTESFLLSSGPLELKVTLDRRIYTHGDPVRVHITVNNYSNKTVKAIEINGMQTADVRMISCGCCRTVVTNFSSKSGCPIRPGVTLYRVVELYPTITDPTKKDLALESQLEGKPPLMAGSTLIEGEQEKRYFGIIIAYSVKVKLILGGFGGEIVSEVPFLLVNSEECSTSAVDPSMKVNRDILIESTVPLSRKDPSIRGWLKKNLKKMQRKFLK